MQTVEDEIETIHLYVVREKEKKPPVFLPLLAALLCLTAILGVTIFSALHPTFEHETLTLPATFLPLQTFSASTQIIPTGVKIYPATFAHGTLTLTNGSVITEQLPAGMIFSGKNSEVLTDKAVTVPAGSAIGYGVALVSAHALVSGNQGNIGVLAINQVYGTSLYIRNLHAFTGGKDAYTVHFVTTQDKQTALDTARAMLATKTAQFHAFLAKSCQETSQEKNLVLGLSWTCQFVTYQKPQGKVLHAEVHGKFVIVEVLIVVQLRRVTK